MDHARLLARVVSARDAFGIALTNSLKGPDGNVQIPALEILIVQRIERMKLKCLMEALDNPPFSLDAVLNRFVAEIEQSIAELGKPQIARAVDRALGGKRRS